MLLCDGEVRGRYHKVLLPFYELFDEGRNFAPGSRPNLVWRIGDVVAGVSICEDLWSPDGPPEAQSAAGAQILLVPNASPFHRDKASSRLDLTDAGFDPAVATDVLRRIDEAEMTRRYTPPRIKVTARAFDQDRRMPLTSNWRAHQRD